MKQDHSSAFVNITGSVFITITLMIGSFLAISFSNETKAGILSKGQDPNTYWDESSCRCLEEEEAETAKKTVFLQAGFMPKGLFSDRSLSR